MHTAHARANTVRAVFEKWSDQERWRTAARRWQAFSGAGSVATISAVGQSGSAARFLEQRFRVWRDRARDAWRVETESATQAPQVTILDGHRWWASAGLSGESAAQPGAGWSAYAYTAGDFLTNVLPDGSADPRFGGSLPDRLIELALDPAPLLALMALEAGRRGRRAGRPAMEARARWRRGVDLAYVDWPYGDEARLSVDADYGVLLALDFLLDGEAFIRLAVLDIAFDEALNASLFEGPRPLPGQVLP